MVNVYASRTDNRRATRSSTIRSSAISLAKHSEEGRPGGPTAQSLGSACLIDPSGLVVTNYHVIAGMTDVKVALSDRASLRPDRAA